MEAFIFKFQYIYIEFEYVHPLLSMKKYFKFTAFLIIISFFRIVTLTMAMLVQRWISKMILSCQIAWCCGWKQHWYQHLERRKNRNQPADDCCEEHSFFTWTWYYQCHWWLALEFTKYFQLCQKSDKVHLLPFMMNWSSAWSAFHKFVDWQM